VFVTPEHGRAAILAICEQKHASETPCLKLHTHCDQAHASETPCFDAAYYL